MTPDDDAAAAPDLAAHVIALELARLGALVRRDLEVADRLHAPDYQLVTPGGTVRTKADYLGDVMSKRLEYVVFEPASDIQVRETPDLVVLRYVARIRLAVGDGDDETEFRAWHTDHYERRDSGWVAVWSQATRIR